MHPLVFARSHAFLIWKLSKGMAREFVNCLGARGWGGEEVVFVICVDAVGGVIADLHGAEGLGLEEIDEGFDPSECKDCDLMNGNGMAGQG